MDDVDMDDVDMDDFNDRKEEAKSKTRELEEARNHLSDYNEKLEELEAERMEVIHEGLQTLGLAEFFVKLAMVQWMIYYDCNIRKMKEMIENCTQTIESLHQQIKSILPGVSLADLEREVLDDDIFELLNPTEADLARFEDLARFGVDDDEDDDDEDEEDEQ